MNKKLLLAFSLLLLVAFAKAQVTADFTSDVQTGCVPLTVHFTDLSTGSILTWTWDFGDGGTGNTPSPSHTYTDTGTFTVSLHCGSFNGNDDEIKIGYITVGEAPSVSFVMSDDSICSGDTIQFTDMSTGASTPYAYSWTFNDNSPVNTAPNPAHIFLNTSPDVDPHLINLVVTSASGCSGSFTDTLWISPTPVASIGIDHYTSGPPPIDVYFSNASVGFPIYNWNFGDSGSSSNSSTDSTPSHTYPPGVYEVILEIGIPGCSAVDTFQLDIINLLGVEERLNDNLVSLYPNPSSDHFVLSANEMQVNSVEVYTSSGKLVRRINSDSKKLSVNTSDLVNGDYFVLVRTNDGVVRKRFSVVR